jgi:hypothetical protein
MNFNLFPKFGSAGDSTTPEELVSKQPWPFWSYTTTPTFTVDDKVYTADEFIKLYKELWTENENNKALLKSIEEDGTKEHNAAVELRQENAKLKKDIEDQKQLKDSLQRVNEKYVKKITENVELIERLLQKEGKSYGITFNEAKTQIIQNDYKKCAEERDEYKHQLNAANKEIEALKSKLRDYQDKYAQSFSYDDMNKLQKEIDKLKESNVYQRNQWNGVREYIINHAELKNHGVVVANACLRFLKERDELKAEVEKLKKESQKHPMYPLHWGGYDGAASAYPKHYSDWLNEQRDKAFEEKYNKNIIDFVESEFSNEDPLEGEQVKEAVEELKNMKTQGFEDYDPSDFEQPVKEVEFNAEELLKRVTEYADTLNDLPKSFPNEFQGETIDWMADEGVPNDWEDDKTTAENLEERFDEGKDVLDYFEKPWKCPCNKCKESKDEKSWEEAASDLALKVAKLERMIEELKVVKANRDPNYDYFMKNGKWPWHNVKNNS